MLPAADAEIGAGAGIVGFAIEAGLSASNGFRFVASRVGCLAGGVEDVEPAGLLETSSFGFLAGGSSG